jgi:Arc/MetJ-type ribon-helix-helix transcriptional regulator
MNPHEHHTAPVSPRPSVILDPGDESQICRMVDQIVHLCPGVYLSRSEVVRAAVAQMLDQIRNPKKAAP